LNLRKYRFHISHEHASFFQDWIKQMKFIINDEEMSRKFLINQPVESSAKLPFSFQHRVPS
jgi:hypothetical protein